jgi:hypothetical protein
MTPTKPATPISMRCPSCKARLRAARTLLGRTCPCPRCRYNVTVRLALPSDADVNLIWQHAETPRLR